MIIYIFLTIFFCHTLSQFDCIYNCERGSCNTFGKNNDIINLRCSEWTSCDTSGKCNNRYLWACDFNRPYPGKIIECNKTGCIPPWGCKLDSFSLSTGSCTASNDFCNNPTKTCCNNDYDCDKFFSPCKILETLVMNTTTTTTQKTTTPSSGNHELNMSLIIGLSVTGFIVILTIIGFVIHKIKQNRRMNNAPDVIYYD